VQSDKGKVRNNNFEGAITVKIVNINLHKSLNNLRAK